MADNSHAVGTLVSIVVPVFNEEELLAKLLESINKNLDGFITYEIIVVDNGSEDNSAKVVLKNHWRFLPDYRYIMLIKPPERIDSWKIRVLQIAEYVKENKEFNPAYQAPKSTDDD